MKTVDRYIEIAKGEVGVVERKYNRVKYNEWYYGRDVSAYDDESSTYAWCAVFISWCAYMANIPESIIPKFALCNDGRTFYKKLGRYDTDVKSVKKGDVIFINWSGGTKLQHVGIVVDVSDTSITTVEGNRSNAVKLVTYDRDDVRLIGFGHPDFEALDAQTQVESDEKTKDTEETPNTEEAPNTDKTDVPDEKNVEKSEEKKSILKRIIEYIIKILCILIGKDTGE